MHPGLVNSYSPAVTINSAGEWYDPVNDKNDGRIIFY